MATSNISATVCLVLEDNNPVLLSHLILILDIAAAAVILLPFRPFLGVVEIAGIYRHRHISGGVTRQSAV